MSNIWGRLLFGEIEDIFVPTTTTGVTVHVGTGLTGTIRADGKWRPLPFGSCRTCMSGSGELRPGLKGYEPSIQCDRHKDAKFRKPRPADIARWPFEDDLVFSPLG